MANQPLVTASLLIDTSLLINHFRKSDKANTPLVRLSEAYASLCISTVTEFEIFSGATPDQQAYWEELLAEFTILPFDRAAAHRAVAIRRALKQKRKSIDTADLFIAAIAEANDCPLATLNRKHFDHIDTLQLLDIA